MESLLFIFLGICVVCAIVVLPFLLLIASAAVGAAGNVDGALWLGRATIVSAIPLDLLGKFLELFGSKGNPDLNIAYMAREVISASLKELGHVKEGLELDKECLEYYKSKDSVQHAASATVRIAMAYRDLGDFKTAQENFDRAIPVLENGYNSSDVMRRHAASGSLALALMAKAQLFEMQQQYDKAEALQRTSVSIRTPDIAEGNEIATVAQEAILGYSKGEQSTDLIPNWCALASCLNRQGRFEDAKQFLSLAENALEKNPRTCLAMKLCVSVTVGKCARREGDLARAEKYLEASYRDVQKTTINKNNGLFAEVYTELGLLRHAQCKNAEADKLLRQSIPMLERRFAADHPELLEPLVAYSQILTDQKKNAEANKAASQAQRIRDKYQIK